VACRGKKINQVTWNRAEMSHVGHWGGILSEDSKNGRILKLEGQRSGLIVQYPYIVGAAGSKSPGQPFQLFNALSALVGVWIIRRTLKETAIHTARQKN
jgi:hypothetical protein